MPTPEPLQISFRADALPTVAARLWQWGHKARVWAFYGGLGAGKTTTIRAICQHLGVIDAVRSPTFALLNEYAMPDGAPLYHMDWYRLRDADEAIGAGMEDAILSGARCFIEWPERAEAVLPRPHVHLQLEAAGEEERILRARWMQ